MKYWLVMALLMSVPLYAQRETGVAVTGTFVDQTGAVLPSAAVELRNAAGTALQSTTSTQTGEFTFQGIPPGRYDVVATFEGFQQTAVKVTVGARAPSAVRITMPLAT